MSDLTKSLKQSVVYLEGRAQRAYRAYVSAEERVAEASAQRLEAALFSQRIDDELLDARRELRHHIAAGDQS